MSVIFKPEVNFAVIPQITTALTSVDQVFTSNGFQAVITSANDGLAQNIHAAGSAHYHGAAMDVRTQGLPSKIKTTIYNALKKIFAPLPPWYINLEFPGQKKEHIHIQYGIAIRNNVGTIVGHTDGINIIY